MCWKESIYVLCVYTHVHVSISVLEHLLRSRQTLSLGTCNGKLSTSHCQCIVSDALSLLFNSLDPASASVCLVRTNDMHMYMYLMHGKSCNMEVG